MRHQPLFVMVVVALALAPGCSADPKDSDEYQSLEQQYIDAQEEVAALEQALVDSADGGLASDVEFTALPENVVPVYGEFGGCEAILDSTEYFDEIQVYDGGFSCPDVRSSDPRLIGDVELTLVGARYVDYLPSPNIPQTGRFEYTIVLTTDDGERWSGEGFGIDMWDIEGTLYTVFYDELAGEGKYEGLLYREWGMQQPNVYDGTTTTLYDGYFTSGWIEQIPSSGS
jgi:hypothetical protein